MAQGLYRGLAPQASEPPLADFIAASTAAIAASFCIPADRLSPSRRGPVQDESIFADALDDHVMRAIEGREADQ